MIDYISLPASVKEPTAIENVLGDGISISCYPNPASDYVVVSGEQLASLQQGRVDLFNISGQRMRSVAVTDSQTTVDVRDLAAGTYLLVIWNGEKMEKAVKILKK